VRSKAQWQHCLIHLTRGNSVRIPICYEKLSIRIVGGAGYKFNRGANHVHHYDIKANSIFAEADFLVRGNSHKKAQKSEIDFL
jgi:hypothetical protein